MPTTPKIDLKAVDEHGRRVYCRDGHRIQWRNHNLGPGARLISGGLCSTGETWEMQRVGYGPSARWHLNRTGKAGWTDSGTFRVKSEAKYARVAHSVGYERKVYFNCSHDHYPVLSSYAVERYGGPARERPLPPEIAALQERTVQVGASYMLGLDDRRMEEAIRSLTEQGWDFVTDDRIRCPLCIDEEQALTLRLAELAAVDSNPKALEPHPFCPLESVVAGRAYLIGRCMVCNGVESDGRHTGQPDAAGDRTMNDDGNRIRTDQGGF